MPSLDTLPPSVVALPAKLREMWLQSFEAAAGTLPEGDARAAAWRVVRAQARAASKEKMMPFPNFHAARVRDPGDFLPDSFRNKTITDGIQLILGKLKADGESGSMTAQSYRFDKDKFTAAEAKKWLTDHKIAGAQFEAAADEPAKKEAAPTMADQASAVFAPPEPDLEGPEEKAGARHSKADREALRQIRDHAKAIHDGATGLGADEADEGDAGQQAKSVSLDDWRAEVRSEFGEQFGHLNYFVSEIYDDYLIVLVYGAGGNNGMAAPAEPGQEQTYFRVGYTFDRVAIAGDPLGGEQIENIQFTPAPAWVRVVPTFIEFKSKKQPDGRVRWAMISSGNARDADGDIVSKAMLKSAVDIADITKSRGPLRVWHLKGSEIGTCDLQMLVGDPDDEMVLLFESGLFDETPAGKAAAEYYLDHPAELRETGGSINFFHGGRTRGGVFTPPGVIVERSVLPRNRAGFPWSGLALKERKMSKVPQEKADYLKEVVGEEEATKILSALERGAQNLKELGVEFKEANPAAEEAPAEPVAEPAAEEPAPVEKEASPAPEAGMTSGEPLTFVFDEATLDAIADRVLDRLQPVLKERATPDGLEELRAAVAAIGAGVDRLVTEDRAKIEAAVAKLPRAQLYQAGIVRPSQKERMVEPPADEVPRGKADGKNLADRAASVFRD